MGKMLDKVLKDPRRLQALQNTFLLDTPAEESFDRLSELAMRLLDAPVALVTLVDQNRQFFKSCIGLPQPWASARETPLSHSFCKYVVANNEPLVINDARQHAFLADNGAIEDLNIAAYLGVPLTTAEGVRLGSFCVIDHKPRSWTEDDMVVLRDLSHSVMSEIDLRMEIEEKSQVERELTLLLEISQLLGSSLDLPKLLQKVAERLVPQLADWAVVRLSTFSEEKIEAGVAHQRGEVLNKEVVQWGRLLGQLEDTHPVKKQLFFNGKAHIVPFADVKWLFESLDQEQRRALKNLGVETFIHVPIYSQNERLGMVLLVYGDSRRRYKTRNLLLAQELAQMVGMAAQNYRLYKQAQQALVRRDEFVQIAAHEVKNPITAVRLGIDVLNQALADHLEKENLASLFSDVSSEIYRLERLVHGLFDISLVDVGQLTVTLHPVDLTRVVQQTVNEMSKLAPKHTFYTDLPAQPVIVLGDAMRLQQALYNLLRNAVKYTESDESKITVALSVKANTAVLSVQDEGIGIPPEQLPRLFDRFYRVNGSSQFNNKQGLGIGLYLVSEIVRRHDGYIDVASKVGDGSTFMIFIPLKRDSS